MIDPNEYYENKNYLKNHIKEYKKNFLFSKKLDWRDENEFRIVIFYENRNRIYMPINNAIEGVIIGDKFPRLYIPVLKKLIDKPIYEIVWISDDVYVNLL